MKNLRNRINIFFSDYDLTTAETRKMSRDDMDDHDSLMTAYESIWLTLEEYDGTEREYAWLTDLYGDLGDYIEYGYDRKAVQSVNNGKRVALFAGIIGLFIFAMCGTVSFDWLTACGLLLSTALIAVAGNSVYIDTKEGR